MQEEDSLAELYSNLRPKNICICKAVSETEILEAISQGFNTPEKIALKTGAMTGCGTCSSTVRRIIEKAQKQE